MAERADEKLMSAMLRIMGYELGGDGIWVNKATGNMWFAGGPLCYALNHGFAAKVRGWMWEHGWLFAEQPFAYTSGMWFYKRPHDDREAAMVCYNMDEHPRAVCEAAIAALKAEKGGA